MWLAQIGSKSVTQELKSNQKEKDACKKISQMTKSLSHENQTKEEETQRVKDQAVKAMKSLIKPSKIRWKKTQKLSIYKIYNGAPLLL